MFVPNSSFHFPKVDGNQVKIDWMKQFPWLCYSPSIDGGFCLACALLGHDFAEGSKVNLLRTDPVRPSSSVVSDFKRHVEGKKRKEDHDGNKTLHKDTSVVLYSVPKKMERNSEHGDEMSYRKSEFEISENRNILRSITDIIIFLGTQGLALSGHRDIHSTIQI